MSTLPQLLEEDVQELNKALEELLTRSEATTALVTDKAGFCIVQQGDLDTFDATSLGALASNSFNANQAIAQMINEPNFNTVYQQGEKHSMLVMDVDEFTVLIIIFPAAVSVGMVKYYAAQAAQVISRQLMIAKSRSPGQGIDLAMLNMEDSSQLFKKKDL
ncbi:MAG: roadblock/LC7 domain-containing protein [Verrucomicrobiota bacterium]|nr:roadblock/LC7 domain-containing protein [Verrucomicrobiota bacterium]